MKEARITKRFCDGDGIKIQTATDFFHSIDPVKIDLKITKTGNYREQNSSTAVTTS